MAFLINNITLQVQDLDVSIRFYERALGLKPLQRAKSGSVSSVFFSDGINSFGLRLVTDQTFIGKYDLGENETHIGFVARDMVLALDKHREMKCVCYENPDMGIYFIEDPDGHWLEILPEKSEGQASGTHGGFAFDHVNINVANSQAAVDFYAKAFGLTVHREKTGAKFKLVFMTDEAKRYKLELTFMSEHTHNYDLGDNPRHLVFVCADLEGAKKLHAKQGYEPISLADGHSYALKDPDGYLNEVVKE